MNHQSSCLHLIPSHPIPSHHLVYTPFSSGPVENARNLLHVLGGHVPAGCREQRVGRHRHPAVGGCRPQRHVRRSDCCYCTARRFHLEGAMINFSACHVPSPSFHLEGAMINLPACHVPSPTFDPQALISKLSSPTFHLEDAMSKLHSRRCHD